MGANVGQTLALGQIGANALALPQQIQNQQLAAASDREVLRQFGIPEDQAATMAPDPVLKLPGGPVGSVLRGIGGVGSILSGLLGSPVPAPRPNLGALISAQQLKTNAKKRAGLEEAANLLTTPDVRMDTLAAALMRADKPEAALSVMRLKGQGAPSMSKAFASQIEQETGEVFDMANPTHNAAFQYLQEQWLQKQARARGLGGLEAKTDPDLAQRLSDIEAERAKEKASALADPDLAAKEGRKEAIRDMIVGAEKDLRARKKAFRPMVNMLSETDKAIDKVLKADTLRGRAAQRFKFFVAEQSPEFARQHFEGIDREWFESLTLLKGFAAQFGPIVRNIGRETGMMSNQDIARFETLGPRVADGITVAKSKVAVLLRLAHAATAPDATEQAVHDFIERSVLPEMEELHKEGLAYEAAQRQEQAQEIPTQAPTSPTTPAPAADPALEQLRRSLPPGAVIESVQ